MEEQTKFSLVDWLSALRLQTKLIFGFILVSTIVSFLTASGIYRNVQTQITSEFRDKAISIARTAALQQNGDDIKSITSDKDLVYEKLLEQNQKIQQSDPSISSVFILRKEDQSIYYVIDAAEPGQATSYRAPYRNATSTLLDNFDTLTDGIAESEIRTEENYSFISAYAPIITNSGELAGIIGVNIVSDSINELRRQILERSVLVFLFALGIGAFFGYVTGKVITEPIIRLTDGAMAFATGQKDINVEVTTNDEIGDLTRTFNKMSRDLHELIGSLEDRVASRTKELEKRSKELEAANKDIQRRAGRFESLVEVSQSIASIHDLDQLLPHVAKVVSNSYGFYHVGVFLVDDLNQYAILTATNSPGGQKMLERHHHLKIGEQGIVGSVASTGQPRIALNVGEDAVFFNNPDLPNTRSEMALPLRSSGKIIGVLDVQSEETNAFSDEDIEALSLLGSEISLAIENAHLFDETIRTLDELQSVSQQVTRTSWKRLAQTQKVLGYRYDAAGARPLKDLLKQTETSKTKDAETVSYMVPIELREQTIGSLVVRAPKGRTWNSDEQDLIKAVADRVALSAENARLFEETNRRAERERLVSEITGKIRSLNDPQAMIDTAVNELREVLGATRVEVVPQKSTSENKEKE